jgi:hypothetical protein
MVTCSTDEAMRLLNERRSFLIAYGRYVAAEICRATGTVHSRLVRREMAKRGLLDNPELADYWLGAVFNNGPFEWTHDVHTYSDHARNIHERGVKVWRLRKGCETACCQEPYYEYYALTHARRAGRIPYDSIAVRGDDGLYTIYS